MKTKTWIILISCLLTICIALSFWLLQPAEGMLSAEIWSDGKMLCTLDLRIDQKMTVTGTRGSNEVTVENGKIAVTHADCPDHYCMQRGWCSGGVQIVCLPNRLVIRFTEGQGIDGISG